MSTVNIYHFYGETLETISSRCFGKHRITLLTLVLLCSRVLCLTCALGSGTPRSCSCPGQGRASPRTLLSLRWEPCTLYSGRSTVQNGVCVAQSLAPNRRWYHSTAGFPALPLTAGRQGVLTASGHMPHLQAVLSLEKTEQESGGSWVLL